MTKNILYLIILLSMLSGCQGLDVRKKIIGDYYLAAPDAEEQTVLCYNLPGESIYPAVISSTVFAAGYNNNYIIAKQHPNSIKTITNYFIVPIKNKGISPEMDKELIGPLTFDEFNGKRKELEIPDNLKFTIEMEDLK